MQRNIFEGSDFLLFDIDQNPIAYCKNSAIKINRALSDITTKDSEGWLDFLNGIKSWSIDFDGLVSYDNDSFSTSYFISKFNNSEPFFIQFGVIQDNFIHTFFGEVAIENIDIEADNGELVTYSGSLKGIGKLQFTNQGTPEQSGYIKTETDPYFRSSPAHSITNSSIDNWNDGYNKTLNELIFNTTGNTTTLKVKLRDGSIYSTSFNHLSSGSGTVLTGLTFNTSSGNLTVNNLTTNLDGRYQPLGSYVGLTYLSDNFYNKSQSDSRFATFNYVDTEISNLVNSAPSTLDTLQELANALGNDENFSTTITALIGTKANASDVYSKLDSHSIFQPLENQRLSSTNNVVFNQITANDKLSIPSTSSNKYSIFVDENFAGSGTTIPIISYLNDLLDVEISSNPVNGNVLTYNNGQWINSTVTSGTFNYNDLINKPTLLSQFTNNLGNYGNWITQAEANGWFHPLENQRLGTGTAPRFLGVDLMNANGAYKGVAMGTSNVIRWYAATNSELESGSNTGSNYYLYRYADNGGYLGYAFSANRASGVVNFEQRPTYGGSAIVTEDTGTYNINILGTADNSYFLGGIGATYYHKSVGFGIGSGTNANTVAENTSSFSYANNAAYNGALVHFGNGGYGIQLSGEYGGNRLAFRNRNGDTATWNTWKEIVYDGFARTWDLNISGNAQTASLWGGRTADLNDFVAALGLGLMVDSSDGKVRLATKTNYQNWLNVNDGVTLNNNISGSASNATLWNGYSIDWSIPNAAPNNFIAWDDSVAKFRPAPIVYIKTALGLPTSGAYDLQWVTDNGAITNKSISIYNNLDQYARLNLGYSVDGAYIDVYNFATSTRPNLSIQPYGGNVGIGTTSPSYKFDVVGDGKFSGQVISTGRVLANKVSGDGTDWTNAHLELQGTNPGIAFHYPSQYAASLFMGSNGVMNWQGNGMNVNNFLESGRIVAGYDSGIVGSVNAAQWFRSIGNTGWYNATYDGGIFMSDYNWVRTYGSKGFLTTDLRATNSIQLPVKNSSGVTTGNHFSIWIEA